MNDLVRCPNSACQAKLRLPVAPKGKQVRCPKCKRAFDPALKPMQAGAGSPESSSALADSANNMSALPTNAAHASLSQLPLPTSARPYRPPLIVGVVLISGLGGAATWYALTRGETPKSSVLIGGDSSIQSLSSPIEGREPTFQTTSSVEGLTTKQEGRIPQIKATGSIRKTEGRPGKASKKSEKSRTQEMGTKKFATTRKRFDFKTSKGEREFGTSDVSPSFRIEFVSPATADKTCLIKLRCNNSANKPWRGSFQAYLSFDKKLAWEKCGEAPVRISKGNLDLSAGQLVSTNLSVGDSFLIGVPPDVICQPANLSRVCSADPMYVLISVEPYCFWISDRIAAPPVDAIRISVSQPNIVVPCHVIGKTLKAEDVTQAHVRFQFAVKGSQGHQGGLSAGICAASVDGRRGELSVQAWSMLKEYEGIGQVQISLLSLGKDIGAISNTATVAIVIEK